MLRFISSSLYGALILFLFLPFMQIKCNESKMAESSGLQMIKGATPTFSNSMMESYIASDEEAMEKLQKQNKPDPILIIFAAIVILGLLFNIIMKRDIELGNTVFSGICLGALFTFFGKMIYANMELAKQMEAMQTGFIKISISLQVAYGFWLSLFVACILLLISIVFLIRYKKNKNRERIIFHISSPAITDINSEELNKDDQI